MFKQTLIGVQSVFRVPLGFHGLYIESCLMKCELGTGTLVLKWYGILNSTFILAEISTTNA